MHSQCCATITTIHLQKFLYPRQHGAEKTGSRSCGALVYDPTISSRRNSSLFTIFQPWGAWEQFSSEPCSPVRPSTSLAPQKAISQHQGPQFPASLRVLKPAAPTVSQQLSPSGTGVYCSTLLVLVQESMCHHALGHGEVQERHKSQEYGLSVCPKS